MSKNEQNEPVFFSCGICNYNTCKKNNFDRHLSTQKHIRNHLAINGNKNEQNEQNKFSCAKCSKEFLSNSGLWRHKKKCINNNQIITCDNSNNKMEVLHEKSITENVIIKELKDIIIEQQNQISKQQEQISEMIPKIGNNNTTQNNKFNIQVFLNEKCKDAINMTDFIKSIQVSIEQLDFTKQNGLANGLSKTIMDNMNKLSVFERPMHCTDIKRETLYIKDENEWTKDSSKEKIKKAIKKASGKNYNALQDWKTENPDFLINDSKTDYFTKTITTIGKPTESIDNKVIKNICKETYIKDSME
tara:strand:- start:2247 stop:3155 length:909 start_codon:yes stop_codon:yes gene_type:complete